ncbi:DNA fragmentation factor subunit beta isoform 6-T6 [Glossophaga mutica]
MMSVFRKPKTFKLRALHSPQKFGVAGKSCQEVLRKGCLHFQNREEAHRHPHAGRGHRGPGWPPAGLGVLLRPALHLREPEAGARHLPQEDHPQAQLRPAQDLQAAGEADEAQEEAGRSPGPVTGAPALPAAPGLGTGRGDGQDFNRCYFFLSLSLFFFFCHCNSFWKELLQNLPEDFRFQGVSESDLCTPRPHSRGRVWRPDRTSRVLVSARWAPGTRALGPCLLCALVRHGLWAHAEGRRSSGSPLGLPARAAGSSIHPRPFSGDAVPLPEGHTGVHSVPFVMAQRDPVDACGWGAATGALCPTP